MLRPKDIIPKLIEIRFRILLYRKHLILKVDMNTIYTIGYQGRNLDEFVEVLLRGGIEIVIDVRKTPFSRKPGFSKSKIEKVLLEHGIRYVHYRELGTPKELRKRFLSGEMNFHEFKKEFITELYSNGGREALKDVERICRGNRCALMCYERNWWECHRTIIAEILQENGFQVTNL